MPHTNIDKTQGTHFTTNAIRAMFFNGPPIFFWFTGFIAVVGILSSVYTLSAELGSSSGEGIAMTLLTGIFMIVAWPVLIFKGAMSGASISVTSDDFGVIVAGWTILVAIVSAVVRPLIKKRTGPRNMTPVIVGYTILFAVFGVLMTLVANDGDRGLTIFVAAVLYVVGVGSYVKKYGTDRIFAALRGAAK